MQPNSDHEARWLAVTSKRMGDRAGKAYEYLKHVTPANDEEAGALNNARLYLASVKEAAEIMRDLYAPYDGPMADFVPPPLVPEGTGILRRIITGLGLGQPK